MKSPWALGAAVGLLSGLLCWLAYALPPASTSDFEPVWVGARALLSGSDPYAVVPSVGTRYPLYYPLPALLVGAPFSAFPFPWARVLWAVCCGAAFAVAALRYGRGLPAAMLSASFLNAVVQGQWSPLLTAAAVLPALGWILVAKPSIGAALFVAFPNRLAVAGGLLLVAASFVIEPVWPVRWWESLRETNHVAPIVRPGGFILLLALLRWRRPEGRLLGAMACVPHTIGLYEALPLFLVPRTRWEGYGLAALSYLAAFGQALLVPRRPEMSWEAVNADRWPFIFLCLYLPALVLVLRQRGEDGIR